MKKAGRIAVLALAGLVTLVVVGATLRIARHRRGVRQADAEWLAAKPTPLGDIGSTSTLTVLPLVDWHAARDDLATDMGVSYLVKTDSATILFDTGNNSSGADPSPLESNMKALGVALDDIDTVVISHVHFDHVGGKQWTDGKVSGTTFGIGNQQPDLSDKKIFTPIEMTYPGSEPETATEPVRIADGVATTGTIPRQLFIGRIDEQALAINVEGKGLVLVVGCGHQTVTRLIERTEAIFDTPIYGVVGGLHYPVPEGRITMAGINIQRRLASGRGPLAPLTAEDVDRELKLLEDRHIGLIAVGGHDSSDQVIESVADRFGEAHRYLRVGAPITVEATTQDDGVQTTSSQAYTASKADSLESAPGD